MRRARRNVRDYVFAYSRKLMAFSWRWSAIPQSCYYDCLFDLALFTNWW